MGLKANGFFFNAELLARASQGDLAISEVKVAHRPRQGGESKVSVLQILPILKALVTFWWAEVAFPQDAAGGVVEIRGKVNRTTHLAGLILGLIAAAVLLPNLSFPFLDPDETRYAEIARGMFETGDYVVPMRAGKAYLDKPPLLYWLTALSYSILGVNEFAARLPVALSGIATVLATYWYGRLLVGTRAAWIAGFLELTCIGFVLAARFVFTDGLLTLFTTAGLLSLFAAIRNAQFRLGFWATGAFCCGLGVQTKGPIAVALCLPPLIAHLWLTGRTAMIKSQHWCLFGFIVAAISLPWFIGVCFREPAFMTEFLFTHHLSRFVSGLSHDEPMWFYIPVLLVTMLPCSILLPAALAVLLRKGTATQLMRTPETGYLILAALWVVGLFSASTCKLPPYILPAIPPLCIIVGTALAALLSQSTMSPFVAYVRRSSPRDVIAILTTAPMILGVVDTALFGGESTDRIPYYGLLTAIGASLLVLTSRGVFKSGPSRWIAAGFYAIALNAFGATNFTGVVALNRFKVPPIVDLCDADLRETTAIVCFSLAHESDAVAFYFPGRNVHAFQVTEASEAVRQLSRQEKSLLLVNRESLATLQKQLPYSVRLVEIGRHEHIVAATFESTSSAQQAFHLDISDATE